MSTGNLLFESTPSVGFVFASFPMRITTRLLVCVFPDVNTNSTPFFFFRGKRSLESICLVLAYKVKYPENFFLLRGNHECASINRYIERNVQYTTKAKIVQ